MVDEKEKEIIGYFTDDRSIYCVECINKDNEIMKFCSKSQNEVSMEI